MDDTRRKGIIISAIIWLVILAGLAVAGKKFVYPLIKARLARQTGSESQYKVRVPFAADAFSGYAVLRSPAFAKILKDDGVKIEIEDDKADYTARMKALQKGDAQMAVFTIDSFLKARVEVGADPATIVAVIDQTVGADAIVAYKDAVAKVQDLDDPKAKFVLTSNSPSEFLARTALASFSLPLLPEQWFEGLSGAGDVFKQMKAADPKAKRAYVLWEPYVSQALALPGTHVIYDSSKCRDRIVDILVVRREFLAEHADIVQTIVAAYFRAQYSYENQTDGMVTLVMEDAKAGGEPLSEDQAKSVVKGIQWKRVLENYAHFGIAPTPGIQPLEDIIPQIGGILTKTHAVSKDPIGGKPTDLYYDGVMRKLHAENFHPGKKADAIVDVGLGTQNLDPARAAAELPAIPEAEWEKLTVIGNARVEPIGFQRGTATISDLSQADLDQLATNLGSWAQYYLRVVGRARSEGDAAANAMLAKERADAVVQYLVSRGVSAKRLHAELVKPNGDAGAAEVGFVLVQRSY
ncbi:MAG: phosphate ABC transporter substrate-binding/OmpA family protein [Candidatus Uhrbacteria bacterium]